jgi:hypothetical protein
MRAASSALTTSTGTCCARQIACWHSPDGSAVAASTPAAADKPAAQYRSRRAGAAPRRASAFSASRLLRRRSRQVLSRAMRVPSWWRFLSRLGFAPEIQGVFHRLAVSCGNAGDRPVHLRGSKHVVACDQETHQSQADEDEIAKDGHDLPNLKKQGRRERHELKQRMNARWPRNVPRRGVDLWYRLGALTLRPVQRAAFKGIRRYRSEAETRPNEPFKETERTPTPGVHRYRQTLTGPGAMNAKFHSLRSARSSGRAVREVRGHSIT